MKSAFYLGLMTCTSFFSSLVHADASIEINTQQDKGFLQVKGSKVLMTSTGHPSEVLFDSQTSVLYIIDHAKRTINPIDKTVIEQLSSQISGVMSVLDKQLTDMPAEQRARVEEFMGGMGLKTPTKEKPVASMVAAGDKEYASVACKLNKVMQGDKHIGTVCLSKDNNTGLNQNDYATLLNLQTFMLCLAKEAGQFVEKFGQEIPSFEDASLESLIIHSASPHAESFSVSNINTDPIEQEFIVPEGYSIQSISKLIK